MTDEQIKQALKLLLKVWEKGDKEAAEAFAAAAKNKVMPVGAETRADKLSRGWVSVRVILRVG